jgi:hypothetical protein
MSINEAPNKNEKKPVSAEEKARREAELAAEKAEVWQSISALYIPFSLFIACVIFSGGAFLVYYNEPIGWAFIATTVVIAISAFIALFKFQNKFRAQGIIGGKDTEMIAERSHPAVAPKVVAPVVKEEITEPSPAENVGGKDELLSTTP